MIVNMVGKCFDMVCFLEIKLEIICGKCGIFDLYRRGYKLIVMWCCYICV